MPTSLSVSTSPLKDGQLLAAFGQLARQIPGATNLLFHWRILEGNDFNSCPFADVETNDALSQIVGQQGEILRWAQLIFQVPEQSASNSLTVSRDASGGLSVNLNLPDAFNQNQQVKSQVAIAFHNVFGKFARATADQLPPALAEFYQNRDQALLRLEEMQTKMVGASEEQRRRADEVLEADRVSLENLYQQRVQQLEAAAAAKADELARKEQTLLAKAKAFDELDNTQSRREIQEKLAKAMQEGNGLFSPGRGQDAKAMPLKIIFIVLVVSLAGGSFWALYETTQPVPPGQPFWFGIARLGLLLAILAVCLVLYVRWHNRWAEFYAREESRLKLLGFDIDRASWLAEFLMEWRSRGGGEFPADLAANLSNHLFAPAPPSRQLPQLSEPARVPEKADSTVA